MNLHPDTKAGAADWMRFAACRDMDTAIWFPDEGPGTSHNYTLARSICAECPVRQQCDAYADTLPFMQAEFGMWAGLSPRQRRERRTGRNVSGGNYGDIPCAICGTTFTRSSPNSKYCGDPACYSAAQLESNRRYKLRRQERERGAA